MKILAKQSNGRYTTQEVEAFSKMGCERGNLITILKQSSKRRVIIHILYLDAKKATNYFDIQNHHKSA